MVEMAAIEPVQENLPLDVDIGFSGWSDGNADVPRRGTQGLRRNETTPGLGQTTLKKTWQGPTPLKLGHNPELAIL